MITGSAKRLGRATALYLAGFKANMILHYNKSSDEVNKLKNDIENIEIKIKNKKTIVFGDFNMNPFEKGLVAANSLHAVSSSDIALQNDSYIKKKKYSLFYNPMWSQFNDLNRVPGSYYYHSSNIVNYYWNIFDQVIIRPDLITYFDLSTLRFITETNSYKLISLNNRPSVSDHLPLYFSIKRSVI